MTVLVDDSLAGAILQAWEPEAGTKAASGDNTLVAAPGAGNRLVVQMFMVQNESATATTCLLKSGSTTRYRKLLQNQGDDFGRAFQIGREWRLGENEALVLNLSGANTHGWAAEYWTEAV